MREKGFSVSILDPQVENWTFEETAREALKQNPKLIAVIVYGHQPSASTQHMPAVRSLCEAIKSVNPSQKIILVGGHAAALPEQTLQEEPVDFVCSGEGPLTLQALLNEFRAAARNLDHVPDLWYWENGQIKFTFAVPLIQNLDEELSDIAWDLLPRYKYRAHNWHCFGGIPRAGNFGFTELSIVNGPICY